MNFETLRIGYLEMMPRERFVKGNDLRLTILLLPVRVPAQRCPYPQMR